MDKILNYEKEKTYYDILGCSSSASVEQICTEYRQKARIFHPDKICKTKDYNNSDQYQRICEAYKVLSDSTQRKDYDKWLNSGLRISYKDWKTFSKAAHTSMHWGVMKEHKLMLHQRENILDEKEGTKDRNSKTDEHASTSNKRQRSFAGSGRSKFRKYQI